MRPNSRLAVLISLVLTSACDSMDRMEMPEKSYPSRSAVVSDGAIVRGWVPSWLPDTARDIREKHDLDSNISQMTFSFETLELAGNCAPIDPAAALRPRRVLVSWWPAELHAGQPIGKFAFHACSADGGSAAYLAIDEEKKRAYFWRP